MPNALHNPLPASLSSECKKAAAILESFINPKVKIDGQIPRKIFRGAKGIAIYTAFRVGFMGSVRFGSGLIVARLPDGSWSAPSAMAMGGIGAGGQFGAELTDFVFVLTTDAAVKTFMQAGSLTLGGNISMAVGPVGRSAEAGGVVGVKSATGVFAYSKTRGLYGGLTVEGGVLAERAAANKKMYGRKIRARELLVGLIPSPPEAEVLMTVLNGEFFQFESFVPSTADLAQPPEQSAETSAQSPTEQPQPIAASDPATGGAAEEATEVAGSSIEATDRAREPHIPENTPPAAEFETDHALGDGEISNENTHDAAAASETPENGPITEHSQAVEKSTEPTPVSQDSSTQHVSPDSESANHVVPVENSFNDKIPHEPDTQQPELAAERLPSDPNPPK